MKICFYLFASAPWPMVHLLQREAIGRAWRAHDVDVTSFALHNETYARLPVKTFEMLRHASRRPECDMAVKLDADGFLCPPRLSPSEWRTAYVGRAEEHAIRAPSKTSRADRAKWYSTVNREVYARIRRRALVTPLYMFGGAYGVGIDLVRQVVARPFASYVDTGFEDANVGLYVSVLAATRVVVLSGRDDCRHRPNASYFHRCKSFAHLCDAHRR